MDKVLEISQREGLQEQEEEKLKEASNLIRDNGLDCIKGTAFDVDTVQWALEILGYKKGSLGEDDIWYRNVVSDAVGYIAELEAINPNGVTVRIVVESFDNVLNVRSVTYE